MKQHNLLTEQAVSPAEWVDVRFLAQGFNPGLAIGICFLLTLLTACQTTKPKSTFTLDEQPPPPAVGYWYEYQHAGPRPWSNDPQDMSGKRSVRVIKQHKGKSGPLWEVEERYEKAADEQYAWYNADYDLFGQMLTGPEGNLAIRYEQALPIRHLKVKEGGEETFTTDQTLLDPDTQEIYGVTKMTLHTKRQHDERVITPAGALMCRHFQTEIILEREVQIKWKNRLDKTTIQFRANEETYWCDKIGWFVKERIVFDPILAEGKLLADGYITESILIDFQQGE